MRVQLFEHHAFAVRVTTCTLVKPEHEPDVDAGVAAGHFGDDAGANEEELLDDADSGAVLVLNRGKG